MKKILTFLLLLSITPINSKTFKGTQTQKIYWGDLEVVYLEDNRFPTYDLVFYFGDGSLSDNIPGSTEAMFDLLSSGTRRYSQKDIAENLEFFGASRGFRVTHEYSTYSVSGLVKDSIPTMKMVCHLFQDATFPLSELKKTKNRAMTMAKNLVNNPSALASRSFREISLAGTPFSYPVGGKLKDLKKLNRRSLKSQLSHFKEKVKKRIYITGPKNILKLETIIKNDCQFKGQGQYIRTVETKNLKANKPGASIVLVNVPGVNQSQIRIGRYLKKEEFQNQEALDLLSGYLGGGFTSQLMQELRVKRGLTYSVSAYAVGQKEYGRAVIGTSTKNEQVANLLAATKSVIDNTSNGNIDLTSFNRAKGKLSGSYPFRFEQNSAYLEQLLFLDHIGKDYNELFKFPMKVRELQKNQISEESKNVFSWDKQTIVILGPTSIITEELKKLGKVKIVDYKRFL